QPRPLYYKIITKYKEIHGGSGANTKKTRLPSRQFVSSKRKTGLNAFERRRQAELEAAGSQTGEETLNLEALDAIAKCSAKTRQTQTQVDLREAVKKLQADLWRDFTSGPLCGTAQKLKQHEKEHLENKEKLGRLEQRHLQEQHVTLPPGFCAFVVLGGCKEAKTRVKKQLLRLGVCGSVYGGSDFLNYISEEKLLAKVGPNHFVYICCDSDSFLRTIHPSVPEDDDMKEGCISLAIRVLGGFVGTEQWVNHAAKRPHEPPAPILRLLPAYEQNIQFYMSDKVHEKLKGIVVHLQNALTESILAPNVRWMMREKRTLLCSGGKKFRKSVVAVVSAIWCLSKDGLTWNVRVKMGSNGPKMVLVTSLLCRFFVLVGGMSGDPVAGRANRKRAFLVVPQVQEATRKKLVKKGVAGTLVSIKDFFRVLTKCLSWLGALWINMGKPRTSGGGKPAKKLAKTKADDTEQLQDDQHLWTAIRESIGVIRAANAWPEAGSDPLPAEGLMPLGPNWDGSMVKDDQEQQTRGCGVLGDLNWERAGPGCVLSWGDMCDARDFHLRKDHIDPLPCTMVLCQAETKRGELTPTSHLPHLAAFVIEWAHLLETDDPKKDVFAKRARVSWVSHESYAPTFFAGPHSATEALPLLFVRCSPDSADAFWGISQERRNGASRIFPGKCHCWLPRVLIFEPAVCQEGNQFACRLSDRLYMSPDLCCLASPSYAIMGELQRLQQLHAGLGKPTNAEGLFLAFQEQVKNQRLKFGSGDSEVSSEDKVAKLLRLRKRCQEANCWEFLKSMQFCNNSPTWASRWSVVTRVLGIASSPDEFGQLYIGMKGDNPAQTFRVAVNEMSRDNLLDTFQALVCTRQCMQAIIESTTEREKSSEWRDLLSTYVNPESLKLSGGGFADIHQEAFLGKTAEQAAVLLLLKQFLDLDCLPTMYAVVASHDTAVNRFSDSRVQNLVKKTIEEHNAVHLTPLPPVAALPDAEEILKEMSADWDDKDVSGPAAEPAAPPPKPKPASDLQKAKVEVLRYCKFVVADITNLSSVQTALADCASSLLPPDGVTSAGKVRGWMFDSGLILEPSEVFSRSHNIYSRANVVKIFGSQAKEDKDALLVFDVGSSQANGEIRKQMNKLNVPNATLNSLLLMPSSQEDLERRAKCGPGGQETLVFAAPPLIAREHRFIGEGTDSTCPWLPIPLPDPAQLPMVEKKIKSQIMLTMNEKKEVVPISGAATMVPDDVGEEELVPLHVNGRHQILYRELFHTFRLHSIVLWTPETAAVVAAVKDKVSCIAILRNTCHMQLLMNSVVEELAKDTAFSNPAPSNPVPSNPVAPAKSETTGEGGSNTKPKAESEPKKASAEKAFPPSDDDEDGSDSNDSNES
ncbi:Cacna2d3, partial [Symbiodinium sp. CCMP2592]